VKNIEHLVVFDKLEINFSSYGIAILENAKEIQIHEKINGEYELSFQMSVTDEKFQYLAEENIIKEPDGQLFVIREIDTTRSGSKLMATVSCEHVFFLALDEYHLEIVLEGATAEEAMEAAFADTPYTVVTIEPITLADIELYDTNPVAVTNEIINQCGGELHRNNFNVSLLNRIGADNGVQFRYRKNMKTIKRNVNTKKLVTRLIPLGKDDLSISSINGGLEYIDSQYIGNYRRPKYGVMRWTEIDDENELLTKAQEYLAKAEVPEVSYEVDVVELKALAEYGNLESFSNGDDVTIIDEELGINIKARIVDYTRYPKEPWKSKVVIANFRPGLEDLQADLQIAKDRVNNFTTMAGRVRAQWLEGIINTLQNQLVASGSFATAQVIDGKGFLLENNDVNSVDYGAMYLGPNILAISSAKDYAGRWIWRSFGTGKGFTADEINAGLLRAELVQIGAGTTYEENYDPSTKINTFRQATPPTAIAVGDLWFDTDDGNKQYRWNGTIWEPVQDDAINTMTDFINTVYPADFAYLEGLIDGNITTWFYGYAPTLENIPASEWVTTVEKNNHLGDLFYDSTTGYAYRFIYDNSIYSWQLIQDTDVAAALALAQQAQDTADGKRRVFLTQPVPPYDIGDLWSGGPTGDMKRCVTAKLTGQSYSAADWELASKYTDDTRANEAIAVANAVSLVAANAITDAAGAQATADGKVTTFFEPEPPTAEGEGDLWIDTNDGNKLYRWSSTSWVVVQDQDISLAIVAAADAQSIADRKIVTFYQNDEPAIASYGDLWFDLDDENKPYRYYGMERSTDTTGAYDPDDAINWVSVQDGRIAIAQEVADAALIKAESALADAATAQSTADGKIVSYYQDNMPTTGSNGDFWVDTNDSNKLYRHNGVEWVPVYDTRIAQAIIDAAGAQATADGKITTFYASSPPTAEALGDLWIDTDGGNELYRWNGTAWISVQDARIAATEQAAINAQAAANTANALLADIANDNKLTAVEKQYTKKEWDIIVSEKSTIDAQATTYGITTAKTNYDASYDTLNTYITPLLVSLTTTSDITGTVFRDRFKDYYDKRTLLLKAISDKAKETADNGVQQSTLYNGVVINTVDGLVVTRGDGKVKTTLNATGGIKIQQLVSGVWVDKFYADVDGKLYAIDMTAQNLTITNELTVGNIPIEEMIASMNTGNQNQLSGAVMQSSSISASKIKTDELIVGTNIAMGPYAVISWDNVSHQPFIPVDAGDVGALPDTTVIPTVPSYITSTKITSTTIESPNIVGGSITSDTTINVGTNATIGRNLFLNPSFYSGINWGSTGVEIYSDSAANTLVLNAPGGVYAGTQRIDQFSVAKFG